MWIPKSEEEIEKAVNSDALEETAIFDAKVALPSKNIEIAKDIAAMSNDGGVIIYGIGEDENKRLKILSPFVLEGQPERISSIAQTSIAEPPIFHIHTIPIKQEPSKGYIVIVIPPSERAPHMVIVSGDHRYYGRNAKGNVLLSEAEVGRLYERRNRLEVDLKELIEKEIKIAPYPPNPKLGYLHVFIRPAFEQSGILDRIHTASKPTRAAFAEIVEDIARNDSLRNQYTPRFNEYINNWEFTTNGIRGKLSYGRENTETSAGDVLVIDVDLNGMGHLFCGRAAEQGEDFFLFFPLVVIANTINFMSFMGTLFQKINYIGMVDIGLAVTGIKGAFYYTEDRILYHSRKPYESDMYKEVGRIDASSLLDKNLIKIKTKELLTHLFRAFTQGYDNPFNRIIVTGKDN